MDGVRIPAGTISPEALDGLIEEFVTRDGTDYGVDEPTLADKRAAVLAQIGRGDAVILFDRASETCNIVLKEDLNRR